MLITCAVYAAAVAAGMLAPVFVLWAARTAPAGASPVIVAGAVVLALAFISALLARFRPRRWLFTAALVSLPIALLGSSMFFALADSGTTYYVWLCVGIGSLACSAVGAFLSAQVVLRRRRPDGAVENGRSPAASADRRR